MKFEMMVRETVWTGYSFDVEQKDIDEINTRLIEKGFEPKITMENITEYAQYHNVYDPEVDIECTVIDYLETVAWSGDMYTYDSEVEDIYEYHWGNDDRIVHLN